jgi:hypothetical protein
MMADAEKALWEAFSRRQLALQPHIHDRLIELMRDRAEISYRQLSQSIDQWCTAATRINRWFNSFPDSGSYVQRPLPLLTAKQRAKHTESANHFLNMILSSHLHVCVSIFSIMKYKIRLYEVIE